MIMYRVKETMFSGISLQEKEVVNITSKTVTYIHKDRGEVRENKKNRSTIWFDNYEDAKKCVIKQLEIQIKTHKRHLDISTAKLIEFTGEKL